MDYKEKLEKVKQLQKNCAKKYGENSLVTMSSSSFSAVPKISSGVIGLDYILGGGFGKGRIIEIGGPESSGKTTLVLEAIANLQKEDKEAICGYIDAENAFDPVYAKSIGVDLDRLNLNQPQSAEEALDIIKDMLNSEAFSIIALDSINAISPQSEQDKDMATSSMGVQARLVSSFLRQATPKVAKSDCVLFILSQIRMKIGVMFGNPEVMGVGNALKFYASQRLDIRRIGTNEDGDEAVSNDVRIKVIKNKLAPPFRKGEFTILFGKGFDKVADLVSCAIRVGAITKNGAWLYFGDDSWQGSQNLINDLTSNKELYAKVKAKYEERLASIPEEKPVEKVSKKKTAKGASKAESKSEETSEEKGENHEV